MTYVRLTDPDYLDWTFLSLAAALAAIHLYLGFVSLSVSVVQAQQFLVVSGCFLVGVLLYVSPYWQSPLYLVFILFATSLGWIWLFGGLQHFSIGVLTGLVAVAFTLVCVYLLYVEEARAGSQRQ